MIPVKPQIAARAKVRSLEEYQEMYRRSLEQPEAFWREQAGARLVPPPRQVLDADIEEVDFSWYAGGRLNACYNCVDRHLATRGDKTAIIWAGDEPGEYRASPTASSSTRWRGSPTCCSRTACARATGSASTCR